MALMKLGYARISTLERVAGFEAQVKELEAAGRERVFSEQVSSVGKRGKLEEALDCLRRGDTLAVTKLDRLARSARHLLVILDHLEKKGANLQVLNLGMDSSTATGKLMLAVIGAVGQFEREIMVERQREGIAKAKAEGKFKGRKPTAMAKAAVVRELHEQGVTPTEIAKQLGIGRASVYRVLARAPGATAANSPSPP